MSARPKDIGTATETAVVRYLHELGWASAERRALHGGADRGDIIGLPHVVIEVKGGHRAERSEPSDLDAWQAQTLNETRHANAKLGLLITKRVGHGVTRVGEWWAWLYLPHMVAMRGERPTPSVWVRLTVEDAFTWLDFAGLKAPHVKSA